MLFIVNTKMPLFTECLTAASNCNMKIEMEDSTVEHFPRKVVCDEGLDVARLLRHEPWGALTGRGGQWCMAVLSWWSDLFG